PDSVCARSDPVRHHVRLEHGGRCHHAPVETQTGGQTMTEASNQRAEVRSFRAGRFDFGSFFFSSLTGLATLLILAILVIILLNILINGMRGLSWHFISTIPKKDFFNADTTGVLPMIVGTAVRVLVMTIFVIPVGVITAIYLTEYAPSSSPFTR